MLSLFPWKFYGNPQNHSLKSEYYSAFTECIVVQFLCGQINTQSDDSW